VRERLNRSTGVGRRSDLDSALRGMKNCRYLQRGASPYQASFCVETLSVGEQQDLNHPPKK
jgi:hypothetical protein